MAQIENQDIINRIADGDMRAFETLVNDFKERVINICFSYTNHLADAEDVSQEVFIEVFRSLHKFKGDSALSTWIFRIASNKSLDHIRKQKRIKRGEGFTTYIEDVKSVVGLAENTNIPDNELIHSQRRELLYAALSRLPKRQSEAFVLTQIEGLNQKMVSEIMNTTIKSVESLVMRGRKKLSTLLEKQIKEYF